MLAELGASLADGTTLQCVRDYLRPELLIIDGFGFDRIEREQTPQALNLLYKVIDQRNTKRSTALITNVEFDDWNQYLSDGPMVMALLDRLFDRAIILRIDGKSYRAHRVRRLPPPGPKKLPARSHNENTQNEAAGFGVERMSRAGANEEKNPGETA